MPGNTKLFVEPGGQNRPILDVLGYCLRADLKIVGRLLGSHDVPRRLCNAHRSPFRALVCTATLWRVYLSKTRLTPPPARPPPAAPGRARGAPTGTRPMSRRCRPVAA